MKDAERGDAGRGDAGRGDAGRGDAGVFGVDVLVKQRSTLAQRHLH